MSLSLSQTSTYTDRSSQKPPAWSEKYTLSPTTFAKIGLCTMRTLCTIATEVAYNAHMATVTTQAYQCDVCGYKWLPRTDGLPECCPSRDCRSRRWNSGVSENREYKVPRKSDRVAGDGSPIGLDALRQVVRGIEQRDSLPDEEVEAESARPECEACGTVLVTNRVMKWDECPECGWHGKKQR